MYPHWLPRDVHRGHCLVDEIFATLLQQITSQWPQHFTPLGCGALPISLLPCLGSFPVPLHSLSRPCGCSCHHSVSQGHLLSRNAISVPHPPPFQTKAFSTFSFLFLTLNMPDLLIHLPHFSFQPFCGGIWGNGLGDIGVNLTSGVGVLGLSLWSLCYLPGNTCSSAQYGDCVL